MTTYPDLSIQQVQILRALRFHDLRKTPDGLIIAGIAAVARQKLGDPIQGTLGEITTVTRDMSRADLVRFHRPINPQTGKIRPRHYRLTQQGWAALAAYERNHP